MVREERDAVRAAGFKQGFLRTFRLTLEAANLDLSVVTEGKKQHPVSDLVLIEGP